MFFFFNDTATTEIYTLSLHDALPIFGFSKEDRDTNIRRIAFVADLLTRNGVATICCPISPYKQTRDEARELIGKDRKSTRLNSSHANISYAVFCLKKKIKYSHRNIRL